jgi:hypothetical protein
VGRVDKCARHFRRGVGGELVQRARGEKGRGVMRRIADEAGVWLGDMQAAQDLERYQAVDEPDAQEVKQGAGAVALPLAKRLLDYGQVR